MNVNFFPFFAVEPNLRPRIPRRYCSVLLLRWNVGWFICDRDIIRRLGPKEMLLYLQCHNGKLDGSQEDN